MASPDFIPYIDLTVHDKSIMDIYNDAIEYAKTGFPEFSPRVGTIENAILEAVAHTTYGFMLSTNRLPNGLMEGLLALMGVTRNGATRSEATIEFEVVVTTGVTIVAGTVVSYDVYGDDGVLTQYLFETDADLEISPGFTTGTVTAFAATPSKYPDIIAGTSLTLVSTTPYVISATLNSQAGTGTDAESDTEYFDRAVKYLASLSNALVTASQLSNFLAITYPSIGRAKVYDLTEAADMSLAAADVPGAVTIALCDSNGDPLPTADKTTIHDNIESRVVAGLTIDTYYIKPFLVDVAVDVVVETGYSTATVSLAVSEAIENYLSIAGWDFTDAVRSSI